MSAVDRMYDPELVKKEIDRLTTEETRLTSESDALDSQAAEKRSAAAHVGFQKRALVRLLELDPEVTA